MKTGADRAAPTRRGALRAALAAAAALVVAHLPGTRAPAGARPAPPSPRRPRWIGHG